MKTLYTCADCETTAEGSFATPKDWQIIIPEGWENIKEYSSSNFVCPECAKKRDNPPNFETEYLAEPPEKQTRGKLTSRIKIRSMELLGYQITREELHLMPYIQYCLMNEQYLDNKRINANERILLREWTEKGFLTGNWRIRLQCAKTFWRAMNELLYLGYVDII